MATQVSAGIVKQGKKVLMIFDEETETYALPSEKTESGELSADTAERAVSQLGCEGEVARYHKQLKIEFLKEGEEFKMQSFTVEVDEEPEEGEWVHISQLSSDNLASPLHEIEEELKNKV